jgi:predicted SnoaL-like aldol condensation-catalyzing enzyme
MMENLRWKVGASLALAAGSAAGAAVPASCDGSADTNRKIVLAFYNDGLVGRKPQQAFMRHMAPDFVEHKPEIPKGTREETASFLAQIIAEAPEARWEIVRTIAEKDMVFLHARFTPASGAPSYALADIFRLKDCKIVEHWDVVGPPPKEQINPHPRF